MIAFNIIANFTVTQIVCTVCYAIISLLFSWMGQLEFYQVANSGFLVFYAIGSLTMQCVAFAESLEEDPGTASFIYKF